MAADADRRPFRFPVQWVNRPNAEFPRLLRHRRGRLGRPGRRGRWSPARAAPAAVKEIVTFDGALDRAEAGDAVTLTLADEIDIARGDLLVGSRPARPNSPTSSPPI